MVCGFGLVCFALWQGVIWSQWSRFAVESWASCAVGNVEVARVPVISQAISRVAGQPARAVVPYCYGSRTYFVSVQVPPAELRLSRSLPTEYVFALRGLLRAAYLRVMVGAAQSDPVVSATCSQLRETRDRLGLDTDQYVELITRFVQQIPYGPVESRFGAPAVVIAEGHAVCSDKSVLLASLLVHEGYDSAVVAIDANHHAAAAIRGVGPGYLRSGYASDLESQFLGETVILAGQTARSLTPYQAYAAQATGDAKQCFAGMAQQHVEALRLASELQLATTARARTR